MPLVIDPSPADFLDGCTLRLIEIAGNDPRSPLSPEQRLQISDEADSATRHRFCDSFHYTPAPRAAANPQCPKLAASQALVPSGLQDAAGAVHRRPVRACAKAQALLKKKNQSGAARPKQQPLVPRSFKYEAVIPALVNHFVVDGTSRVSSAWEIIQKYNPKIAREAEGIFGAWRSLTGRARQKVIRAIVAQERNSRQYSYHPKVVREVLSILGATRASVYLGMCANALVRLTQETGAAERQA